MWVVRGVVKVTLKGGKQYEKQESCVLTSEQQLNMCN